MIDQILIKVVKLSYKKIKNKPNLVKYNINFLYIYLNKFNINNKIKKLGFLYIKFLVYNINLYFSFLLMF